MLERIGDADGLRGRDIGFKTGAELEAEIEIHGVGDWHLAGCVQEPSQCADKRLKSVVGAEIHFEHDGIQSAFVGPLPSVSGNHWPKSCNIYWNFRRANHSCRRADRDHRLACTYAFVSRECGIAFQDKRAHLKQIIKFKTVGGVQAPAIFNSGGDEPALVRNADQDMTGIRPVFRENAPGVQAGICGRQCS